jgi:tetratricopeptide (TPR) repeat protein
MEESATQLTTAPRKSRRQTFHALRPLLWWFIFVLVLCAVHTHERLMKQTAIHFSVAANGKAINYEVTPLLDGKPVSSGDLISLGRHTLTLNHPKMDPFSTNLFTWYGGNHLGLIKLTRSMGRLIIESVPRALELDIRGPEFAKTLRDSSGFTSSVPTDEYVVRANYLHGQETKTIAVSPFYTPECRFAPSVGVLQLFCDQTRPTFKLLKSNGEVLETGNCPAILEDVPAGDYDLVTFHRDNRQQERVTVQAGMTNSLEVRFQYGIAVIETDPTDATVETVDVRYLGTTPAIIQLPAGSQNLIIRRQGYERVSVSLQIVANQTNTFQTNLLSTDYVRSMEAARQYMAAADYDRTWQAAKRALDAKPGDHAALALQNSASVQYRIRQAKAMGKQKDYKSAIRETESALKIMPDLAEAKQMLADFQKLQSEVEVIGKEKSQATTTRLRNNFNKWMDQVLNSSLFDQNEVVVKGNIADVESNLVRAFTNGQPAFRMLTLEHPETDLFQLQVKQDLATAGWRRCNLAGTQTGDNEVTIIFKVYDYTYEDSSNIRAWFGDSDMVPIHSSRIDSSKAALLDRRPEGIELILSRIRAVSAAKEASASF